MNRRLLAGAALTLLPVAISTGSVTASDGGSGVATAQVRVASNGVPENASRTGATGPRRDDEPDTGLAVTLNDITPAHLRPGEPITVRGTIENLDREPWRDLQVYLLRPSAVSTTTEELSDLAATPANTADGERITVDGRFLELGALAPGARTSFSLTVPFQQLQIPTNAYGVYTLAVQVMADDELDTRHLAGRARTMIPLMPAKSPKVSTSTIWPFRANIVREANGSYPDSEELIEDVSAGGRLRVLLNLARTSGTVPVSVLIDPAVVDALQRIVNNDTGRPQAPETPSESPDATEDGVAAAMRVTTVDQQAAAAFLDDLTALAREQTTWAEGFGGPDLMALSGYDASRLYRTISRANKTTMNSLELSASRAFAPTDVLDVTALATIGPRTTTFVSGDQVRRWDPYDGPVGTVRADGERARVVVSHSDIFDGGLTPGPTDSALQVRQRLLAETAVLSLEAAERGRRGAPGLVVLADDQWDPGPNAAEVDFFDAFEAPWIDSAEVSSQIEEGPRRSARRLRARHHVPGREDPPIPTSLARAADRIRGRGVIMYAITRDDPRVLTFYDQAALLTISEHWRSDPETPQDIADETITELDRQLAGVTIEAPEFVTLSSSSGRFPLTITNELPWPITVGVRLDAEDGGLVIEQSEAVDVDPQQSTTVNVSVDAQDVAVSEVTARLTTPRGRPFGDTVTFKMRSSVVGTVIWIALGATGVVIVFAIGRRIRRSTRSKGEPVAAEPAADPG